MKNLKFYKKAYIAIKILEEIDDLIEKNEKLKKELDLGVEFYNDDNQQGFHITTNFTNVDNLGISFSEVDESDSIAIYYGNEKDFYEKRNNPKTITKVIFIEADYTKNRSKKAANEIVRLIEERLKEEYSKDIKKGKKHDAGGKISSQRFFDKFFSSKMK